jgi:hypothetical protein
LGLLLRLDEAPWCQRTMACQGAPTHQVFLLARLTPAPLDGGAQKRHDLQDEDACALCIEDEASDHLLCGCVVTRELWFALLSPLGLQELAPASGDALKDWWLRCRRSLTSDSGTRRSRSARLMVC